MRRTHPTSAIAKIFGRRPPIIGMIHLLPLPGSPRWGGSIDAVFRAALHDARVLAEEGFDALLVENYGDTPFVPEEAPPATVASMTAILVRLREALPRTLVWGVNVLRNDASGALAVAAAAGASFIRINVHLGAVVTDQGLLSGRAHETLRLRAVLAPDVAILADAQVKHGRPLAAGPLDEEVRDLVERGMADAVLVTGPRTGAPADLAALEEAVRAASPTPVLAASGVDPSGIRACLDVCQGVIVGTALKRGGNTEAPVDRGRARRLLAAAAKPKTAGRPRS